MGELCVYAAHNLSGCVGATYTPAPGGRGYAVRVNVWLPDDLSETVKARMPGVNVSQVLQEGLRALLGCRHERAICAACAEPLDLHAHADAALERFYLDLFDGLAELVQRGGTAEGACRVAKDIGTRHQIGVASRRPLPRPTRAERFDARVKPFPGTEAIA